MRTVFFIPPLTRDSGGLAAIRELVAILHGQGHTVAITAPSDTTPGLADIPSAVERIPWSDRHTARSLSSSDLWCVPESWPNAMAPGIEAGARTLVYVQNWIFMMTTLPHGVQWAQLPVEYLAVSQPVAWFMREVLNVASVDTLPPSVNAVFFRETRRSARRVRVTWMPRKNKALAMQIMSIATARLASRHGDFPLDFVEIRDCSPAEVADAFARSHIFLSTGFPEGFGLPPLEAMASGCVPVGFTGLGGWQYMRNPEGLPLTGLHSPPCGQPEIAVCGPNGLFVSDGDVLSAGLALAWAAEEVMNDSVQWRDMALNAQRTAVEYTQEARECAVRRVWEKLNF